MPCSRLVSSPGPSSPTHGAIFGSPSTPPLEVSGKFGGDLRERPGDLASVHSTQSTLASAGSSPWRLRWWGEPGRRCALPAAQLTLRAPAITGGPAEKTLLGPKLSRCMVNAG